jgi:hypothetical protein
MYSDTYANPASHEKIRHRLTPARLDPFTSHRLQRGSEHIAQLGPRALAEFLVELASQIGGLPATLALLAEYERRLTPAMLRLTGGDRFPTRRLRAVPR